MDDLELESYDRDDSNSSLSKSSGSASPHQEALSWEVLDCSDSDSRPANDAPFSQLRKQASDASDWILQPDNDREGETEGSSLPVIESITSLSALDDDKEMEDVSKEGENRSKDKKPSRNGQSRCDDGDLSEDENDKLIIDTSALATNLEKGRNRTDSEGKDSDDNASESGSSSSSSSSNNSDSNSNSSSTGQSKSDDKDEPIKADSSRKTEKQDDKSTEGNEKENDESDVVNLMISSVQGNVEENMETDETPLPSLPSKKDEKQSSSKADITETASNDADPATPSPSSENNLDEPERHLIVIDPEGPEDKTENVEHIHFKPGIIKLEPEDGSSNTKNAAKGLTISTTSVSLPVTSPNISTQASLSAGTMLTTAAMLQAGIVPTQGGPNMNMAYKAFQQQYQFGSRTILKTPPKNIPQFLVRHGGPRSKPSYIRLGSAQTLQHFARMSAPGQTGGPGNQQRMISVLMDRNNPNANSALPPNFSQLLQAGPPGTLVSTGGPGGNPVKVLILPSQASGAQLTQSNLHVATSGTPPMYSVTTSGNLGALTSVANLPAGSKVITSSVPSTPELKSASQMLKNAKTQGGGKSKAQGNKNGGSKVRILPGRKSTKTASQDGDADSLLQNLNVTEERLKRRLLSKTNLIKEYHPSLTSGLGHISFEFYSCHGCRDVFVNKSSLEYHRNRQSMCINYNCEPCKVAFTFSNKCQFRCHMLKHVQELKLIHKNLLDRIGIRATQYSASKSKGHPEDHNRGIDGFRNLDSPLGMPTSKEPSPSPSEMSTATNKDADKGSEVGSDNGSTLGLTITSVSSLGEQHDQHIPAPPPMNAHTPIEIKIPQPPPQLSMATRSMHPQPNAVPSKDAPMMKSPPIIIPGMHSAMGPLAQPSMKSASGKPESKAPVVESQPKITEPQTETDDKSTTQPGAPPVQNSDGGNIFCTECSMTFSSYMKLQRHFNDADKPHPLRPPCCNVRLATECCVRAHMRTHSNNRPLVCSDCGECFRGDLKIFKKHTYNCKRVMLSAVIVYPCPRCQSWYTKIDELRNHVRKTHSESYLKCNICPMAFKSIASFSEHNTNKHPSEKTDSANFTSIYKCPLCDSVFHDQQMKLEHLEQHMNNIYANQRVSFVCQLCNKLSHNYAMMRYHLKEKHMVSALGNMCDLCGVDAGATIKHLVAHQRKIHNTFPANMLVDPFSKTKGADKLKTDSNGETTSDKNSIDLTSSKLDNDLVILGNTENGSLAIQNQAVTDNGESSHHGNPPRASSMYNLNEPKNVEGQNGESQQRVRCHLCQQYFINRKELSRHKKVDHGMIKGKRVRTDHGPPEDDAAKRARHDEDLLDETTPQFQVKSNFMLRFECDDCDYRTPTFQDLQQHQADVHGIEARFPCLLCGIIFHTMGRLEEHMKNTHEGQIREYPYLCWTCEDNGIRKGYTKRAHLVRHFMNYHKIASKAIDSDRLDEMDKKATQSEEDRLKEDGSNEKKAPRRPRIEGEDAFACIKCDFECKDRQQFQEHITKHKKGGADSYQCPECGMCFTVLPPLKNHLRLVHKIKNFNEYIEKNDIKLKSVEPDKAKASAAAARGKTPVAVSNPSDKNPLECTVCYRQYPDQELLKKHMRSHGMAFIRSKRLAPMAFLAD